MIAHGIVYVFADGRGLVAHDLETGMERLRVEIPRDARPHGLPLPFGHAVLVFESTGALRAYR